MPSVEKEVMYRDVKKNLEGNSALFSNFDSLSVMDFEELRGSLRKNSNNTLVVKKSILEKVCAELGITDIDHLLDGSVLMTTFDSEPQEVSKVLVKFGKERDNFNVSGAWMDGELKTKEHVVELSKLPSREELIAKLVGTMKAPVNNFVLGLGAIVKNFVVVVNEVKKQKEQGE